MIKGFKNYKSALSRSEALKLILSKFSKQNYLKYIKKITVSNII